MADLRSVIEKCLFRSNHQRRSRLRKVLAGLACSLAASSFVSTTGGCASMQGISNALDYSECCDDMILGYRNSAWSARAWHERRHCFANEPYIRDFRDGFRQGYEDVASGGNGCTPMFPPRDYWGWKFQTPEGQLRVNAWFAGYPHGARAAEEDGLGNYGQIQLSGEMTEACLQCGLGPAAPVVPAPQTPTPQHDPAIMGLLGEGESIVGKVEVQSEGALNPKAKPQDANVKPASPSPTLPVGTGAEGRPQIKPPSPF